MAVTLFILQLSFILVAGFGLQTSAFRLHSLPRQNNESWRESFADVMLAPLMVMEENFATGNATERCHSVVVRLAQYGSNFTHCLIIHSRPFRVCEKCVKHYTRFVTLYHELRRDVQCRRMLLLSDSMQFINSVHKVFTSAWANAHCDACFDHIEQNSTTGHVTFNLTADAIYFMELEANVSSCFNNYTHMINQGNSSEACQACREGYWKLNKDFYVLKRHSHGHICMDLLDRMNTTWQTWSTDFHCPLPLVHSSTVITISVVVGIVTFLLYPFSRIVSKIRETLILEQKRMKSSRRYKSRYGALSAIEEDEDTTPLIAAVHVQGTARRQDKENDD